MSDPTVQWLAEVSGDSITICPSDVIAEARNNLRMFFLTDEERAVSKHPDITQFLRDVANIRGEWLAARRATPMRFYAWYDAQAGQLRFSLISAGPDPLPFARPILPVDDPDEIVQEFVANT